VVGDSCFMFVSVHGCYSITGLVKPNFYHLFVVKSFRDSFAGKIGRKKMGVAPQLSGL
jgi:hypothetical protein